MARPFEFPDPRDRSPNEPTTIASQNQVLGLYNQSNPDDKRQKVTDSVREWFSNEAKSHNWSQSEFHGSQCLLTANVILDDK